MRSAKWAAIALVSAISLGYPGKAAAVPLETMIREYGTGFRDSSVSVERIYGLARSIGDSLLRQPPHGPFDLQSMDTTAFASLASRLPGMTLIQDAFLLADIDVPTFQRLARVRGDSADVAFFATLFAIEDSSSWPNYAERQTDESGCVRFGSGLLVGAYERWRTYLERHPGRYAAWAEEEAGVIATELAGNTCACGDRASVLRELRLFLDRFPRGEDAQVMRARLDELRAGRGELREHCGQK